MINNTLKELDRILGLFKNPIVMWSSGKDSMVMLYLTRLINPKIPVLFFKEPFMQKKHNFAYNLIQEWDLTVYDYHPLTTDYLYNTRNGCFDVYSCYDTNGAVISLARGLIRADIPSLCAIRDFLNRPLGNISYKWDLTLHGHKNSDIDTVLEDIPLQSKMRGLGRTVLYYPLKDWSDNDIWKFIKDNNIPYNKKRYDDNDMEYNNDYYPCCFKCFDPKEEDEIYCFVDDRKIGNIGKTINYNGKFNLIKKSFSGLI